MLMLKNIIVTQGLIANKALIFGGGYLGKMSKRQTTDDKTTNDRRQRQKNKNTIP